MEPVDEISTNPFPVTFIGHSETQIRISYLGLKIILKKFIFIIWPTNDVPRYKVLILLVRVSP